MTEGRRLSSDLINILGAMMGEVFSSSKMAVQNFSFPSEAAAVAGHTGIAPELFTDTVDNFGRLQGWAETDMTVSFPEFQIPLFRRFLSL